MEGLRSSVYALAIISVSVGIVDVFSGFGNLKKYLSDFIIKFMTKSKKENKMVIENNRILFFKFFL